jgi:hypothetical protein
MELFFNYLLFCIVTALALFTASKRHSSQRHWELSPEIIMVISFFLYTSAMPASRMLWGTEAMPLDIPFMQTHLLANLGLLVGLVAGKLLSPPKAQIKQYQPLPPARVAMLATGALIVFLGYIYYSVGFSVANMFRPYGFETTLNEISTVDTLMEPAVCVFVLHCYLGAFILRNRKPWLHRYVLAIAGVIAVVFLVRGMRNPAQILWLPIFAIAFRKRRIPVFKATAAVLIAFVIFSVVASVRNFGILSEDKATINSNTLDPLHGELGTSYNVFTIFDSLGYGNDLQYGKTYTVDLGVNLVPHALWPNRPPSTAIKFSMRYYQTENLTEGLGFSPVVEALVNFSEGGLPIVFAAFAFGVVALANILPAKGRWGMLCYAMMLPMLVNWNRIDSNASFKMFAVYCGFAIALDWILYRRLKEI